LGCSHYLSSKLPLGTVQGFFIPGLIPKAPMAEAGPSLGPTQSSNASPSGLASPGVPMCPWASHRAGNADPQRDAVKSLLHYSTCSIRDVGK